MEFFTVSISWLIWVVNSFILLKNSWDKVSWISISLSFSKVICSPIDKLAFFKSLILFLVSRERLVKSSSMVMKCESISSSVVFRESISLLFSSIKVSKEEL